MLKAIKQIYMKHFKKKLFIKLIVVYSIIAVASLVTLSVSAYQFFVHNNVNNALFDQQRNVDSINRFLDQKYDTAQAIIQQVYQDTILVKETVYLLNEGLEEFIRYRLDSFSSSNGFYIRNMHDFFSTQFVKDQDLQNINLISQKKKFAYIYYKGGFYRGYFDWSENSQAQQLWQNNRYAIPNKRYSPEMENSHFPAGTDHDISQKPIEEIVNVPPFEPEQTTDPLSLLSVTNRISNPETLATAGDITIDFNAAGISRQIGEQMPGEQWLVLDSNRHTVYHTERSPLPVAEQYYSELLSMPRNKSEQVNLNGQKSYVMVSETNKLGLVVVNAIPEKAITDRLSGIRNTIGIITLLCIITVLVATYFSVLHLSRRTQTVIKGMKKVREGYLNTKLPVDREDELGLIALSFNQMCEDLQQYINKVYKSELKQKNAELVALQSQIKPHFLYNTLEVIRMRAISQGANDVGDMIYNLASMFRHMVKDKTTITLNEEIENCRRYLELTRIRYRDKLQYSIYMDERLGGYNIMKLSVQPIIENYLVHGLGLDRTDNHIIIEVESGEKDLVIRIADNGKGIESERLQQIQKELKQSTIQEHGSLGLKNVHDRLRILYGDEYGIKVESVLGSGTTVTIRVPLN
ncbi:sensor histidine kinase [Paenibacillus thiaminolyticus]|uniref:Sensor histidine kinase n=1 Tax=Paenibacillus thiaminolyticus TaxID=49283 RepID=A0A3A3GJL7_PANTH|nr:sensor histidine kinase [Paenibacillus thiaminolyticus]RJG24928.1 sensor histidine kinase [Paenibacillus thiaminolyticus]